MGKNTKPLWWSTKNQPADGNIGVINYDNYRLKLLVYPWWETASSTMFRSIYDGQQPGNTTKVYFTDLQNIILSIEIAGIKLSERWDMSDQTEISIGITGLPPVGPKVGFLNTDTSTHFERWMLYLDSMNHVLEILIMIEDQSMKHQKKLSLHDFGKEHPKLLKYTLKKLFDHLTRDTTPSAAAAA